MAGMRRSIGWLFLSAGLVCGSAGCGSSLFTAGAFKSIDWTPSVLEHGTEKRVIDRLSQALQESNERAFRRAVSTRFEQKALRSPDAFRDLEILKLPKAELEVVESTEKEAGRYETVAKEKDGTTRYQFILVRDAEKNRWVVDDVMLRQQKKGTRSTKSSVELMDLLLTLREFLGAWQEGGREEVLAAVSGDLQSTLEGLPDPWLEQLTKQITNEYETGTARRPEIQMNETDAVGKIPSKNGFLLVKVRQEDDRWSVADIEVRHRRGEHHAGSLLRQARAMTTVCGFLGAYGKRDLSDLENYAEDRFFKSSLRVGELSLIPLPSPNHAPDEFEIQSFAGKLTVMIPGESSYVRMDLVSPEDANAAPEAAADRGQQSEMTAVESSFRVSDVTLYDRQTSRQTNLRAAFTAPARAMLFMTALADGDLPVLRQISSQQLTEEVWKRMEPGLLSELPLDDVPRGELKLTDSEVLGETTELQFEAADGRLLSVILQDENGNLVVTDVQYPGPSLEVASLRTQLLMSRPLVEFAKAWEASDLDALQAQSSTAFNRLVWSNMSQMPTRFTQLPQTLRSPIRNVDESPDEMRIDLGRSKIAATVRLIQEKGMWVIDEITLNNGRGGTAVELRKTLRDDLAAKFLARPAGSVQTVGHSLAAESNGGEEAEDAGVVHAVGRSAAAGVRRGNLTLSSRPVTAAGGLTETQGLDLTPVEPALKPISALKPAANTKPTATADDEDLHGSSGQKPGPVATGQGGNVETDETVNMSPGDLHFGPPRPTAKWKKPVAGSTRELDQRPVEIPLE
ncbi:MAG: hypothetical protein RLZZ458_1172 [Planctomycetota bacterium]